MNLLVKNRDNSTYRLFVFSFISALFLFAEASFSSSEADRIFDHGLKKFLDGRYISARLDFHDIIHELSFNSHVTSAHIMEARCLLHLGEYDECLKELNFFREKYPRSRYIEFADYLTGHCYFRKKKWTDAASQYMKIIKNTKDERLRARAHKMLYEGIALLADNPSRANIANKLKINLVTPGDGKPLQPELQKRSQIPDKLTIGVLAPLSPEGGYASLGKGMERGIRMAIDSHQLGREGKIILIVEDTMSDPVGAATGAEKLIRQGVTAIIGPIYTESTIPAAALANAYQIPFLAPTASHGTLTDIGPYVYQLNVNPYVQGMQLARYAYDKLFLRNFALISTKDSWGRWICEGFVDEIHKQGGKILSKAWYDPADQTAEISNQMSELRRYAPKPDSIDTVVEQADSIVAVRILPEVTDDTVLTFDGILISAPNSATASYIASQLANHKIEGQLLGDSGWYSSELTEPDRIQYIQNAIFVGSVEANSNQPGYRNFLSQYRQLFKEDPDIAATMGYDAANLILQQFVRNNKTPQEIKRGLDKVARYEGVSITITLSGKRQNIAVKFFTIRNGRIQPVHQ